MRLIFPLFFTLVASVFGAGDTHTRVEAELFWERELQTSVINTPAPTARTVFSTDQPTSSPVTISLPVTTSPTIFRTPSPTRFRTPAPTFRCNLSLVDRRTQILSILSGVSDTSVLITIGSPQNNAAEWLIGSDEFYVCPSDEKLIQRYVMALFYYSTGGEFWTLCNQNDLSCTGDNIPFLAPVHECDWFGLGCDDDLCMVNISFEANNVGGTIPFELEQLSGLEIISLEQGSLQQTIPSNLGTLNSLRILDLDFNTITGTIPEQIYGLSELLQLDLNSNKFTGTLSASVGNLLNLQLLQLYENIMTGTIPETLGNLKSLVIGEFYNNTFTGVMPQSVCDNRSPDGILNGLTSDCFPNPTPQLVCTCCSGCAVY